MKIARYWEKTTAPARLKSGKTVPVRGWGWSAQSCEEALQRARNAAARSAAWLEARNVPIGEYGYHDRPPREEILREISDASGQTIAFISRNSYGVEVLNTQNLMFIDVDIAPESVTSGLKRAFNKLLGRSTPDAAEVVRQRIAQVASQERQYSFRLYRTAAGFRCVLINRVLDASSAESRRLLEAFGSDALYQKLCRSQQCYRARLTPKFWRVNAPRPPHRFPYDSAIDEAKQRAWEREYSSRCTDFATCRFIEQYGCAPVHGELSTLLELHDRATKAKSEFKLA